MVQEVNLGYFLMDVSDFLNENDIFMLRLIKTIKTMSRKSRNLIKLVAIIIVIVLVFMELGIIAIPVLAGYKFWLSIVAFALVLVASR
jgi:hypothetical protein